MQLVQSGKWLQGGLHLQHPESRVGTDEIVRSSVREKPWGGGSGGKAGTWDKEINGSICENLNMGLGMENKRKQTPLNGV